MTERKADTTKEPCRVCGTVVPLDGEIAMKRYGSAMEERR